MKKKKQVTYYNIFFRFSLYLLCKSHQSPFFEAHPKTKSGWLSDLEIEREWEWGYVFLGLRKKQNGFEWGINVCRRVRREVTGQWKRMKEKRELKLLVHWLRNYNSSFTAKAELIKYSQSLLFENDLASKRSTLSPSSVSPLADAPSSFYQNQNPSLLLQSINQIKCAAFGIWNAF